MQRKVIDFLRFPLSVMVVFIHNHSYSIDGQSFPVYSLCNDLFSEVLGRVAVPVFFLISGFLFFLKENNYTLNVYMNKLKSRTKTLLIPYLFWMALVVIVFNVVIPLLKHKAIEMNWLDIFQAIYARGETNITINYPLWFIRDLFLFVIASSPIYLYIRKTKIFGIITLGCLWYFGQLLGFIEHTSLSLFFFSLGAYLGINKRNVADDMQKIKWIAVILYPMVVVVDLYTKHQSWNFWIHNAGILFGIAFWFNMTIMLVKGLKIEANRFLSASSFFIFAIHTPLLLVPVKIMTKIVFSPATDMAHTNLYFTDVMLVITISLGLYYISRCCFPKFTNIITGGR